jgi:hypothetical protein
MKTQSTNTRQLQILQVLIKHVFLPLETKNELKQNLQKFVSQISHSSQQVQLVRHCRYLVR